MTKSTSIKEVVLVAGVSIMTAEILSKISRKIYIICEKV